MAITVDSITSSGAWNNAESTVTWSHTCSGSDRVLVVFVDSYANKTTGVTYAGVSMTFVAKQWYSVNQRYISCYVLVNPASGTNNIVWSLSGNDYCNSAAISYTGAKQTGQPQAYDSNRIGQVTPFTSSVATTGTCRLVMSADTNSSATAGTGVTLQVNTNIQLFTKDAAVSAGTNGITINPNTAYNYPQITVAIEEAAASPTNSNFFALM